MIRSGQPPVVGEEVVRVGNYSEIGTIVFVQKNTGPDGVVCTTCWVAWPSESELIPHKLTGIRRVESCRMN